MDRLEDLGSDTDRLLDLMVEDGHFPTREDAVRAGLRLLQDRIEEDAADDEPLDDGIWAAIERGRADVAAGRVYSVEEVFDELLRDLPANQ